MHRRGPRYVHGEGSRKSAFEALSHGFGTGCLRFAGRVAPTPRKTRFRLLAKLFRTGLITRRVPSKGFTMYPTFDPPFPSSRSARTFYFFSVFLAGGASAPGPIALPSCAATIQHMVAHPAGLPEGGRLSLLDRVIPVPDG